MTEALLELRDITVEFEGFKALNNISFNIQPNTIKVLIGPNGAGKSTLCDCVIGKVRPSQGSVYYKGRDITALTEYKITQAGICRKFQAPGVLERLSVFDNLTVAAREQRSWVKNLHGRLSQHERQNIEDVLARVGLTHKRDVQASHLAHGEKQWLEIGMVVVQNPELLLLDEPTAGMTSQETAKTAELIRQLAQDHTVLVIDHDMSFVELLDAPVSILHQGQLLVEGSMAEVRNNEEVINVYLGRSH
ncbi:MAG: urea ABC transporter ATP-binding protein UrtD [Deinococcota bacterium]